MKQYTVITGASSGIGKAMAYAFAAQGHNLIIVARREALLEQIKADIEKTHGVSVVVIVKDLSIRENVRALYETITSYAVTTLINNAGFGDMDFVWDIDDAKLEQMIDLNVTALSLLSVWFARANKDRDVTLLNVASVVGYRIFTMATPYSATKFYVASFTEGLAHNLAAVGAKMKAKVLCPGPVETEFFDVAMDRSRVDNFDRGHMRFHTAEHMAACAYSLYESDKVVGIVDAETMTFNLKDPLCEHM